MQQIDPTILLGPIGLTLFLLYAIKRLWDSHERSDRDVVAQRDEAIHGWREQSQVTARLAEAIEASNRDAAGRQRLQDAS